MGICGSFWDSMLSNFGKHHSNIAVNHRLVALEKVAHVGEGKPHGFVLQTDFEAGLYVGGLVEDKIRYHYIISLKGLICL